ncbi:hypothetical protein FACS1894208_04580 [Clostridia bacterium]|nr:hypothetical protein FACS1894208_04580 [Clostridia bacterium]
MLQRFGNVTPDHTKRTPVRAIARANDKIITRGTLNISHSARVKLFNRVKEKLAGIERMAQFPLKFLAMVFNATIEIDKVSVNIVENLVFCVAIANEKHLARAAKDLDIALDSAREM